MLRFPSGQGVGTQALSPGACVQSLVGKLNYRMAKTNKQKTMLTGLLNKRGQTVGSSSFRKELL